MACNAIVVLVMAACVCLGSTERPPPPPLPPAPASFSGVFDHNMVLQRAPSMAALYGSAGNVTGSSPAQVTVHVSSSDRDVSKTYTSPVDDEGNWKVLLDPAEAGGDYTMSVACTRGCMNTSEMTLVNVTYGDVYFCSGQSNMELKLHFTFSRNDTLDAIGAGKYHNIRIRQFPHSPSNDTVYVIPPKSQGALMAGLPAWLTAQQAHDTLMESNMCGSCGKANRSVLMQFSAACWYFAQALTDELGANAPPLGMISSSVGGTQIEAWTPKNIINKCQNNSCAKKPENCGILYNGMVCPYLNMTIKGILWYQGENNMGGTPGNVLDHVGYGCMLPNMVQTWRQAWSAVPNTTNPLAPFGVYTLAAGTSEGASNKMGSMRWAQTANHGVVPNEALPNVFIASGYDLGEPWGWQCEAKNCCQHTVIEPQPPCSGDTRWSEWQTHSFMGGIHPRTKYIISSRAARAASVLVYGSSGPYIGPVITGCSMSSDKKSIEIRFNKTLLALSDKVIVQEYNSTANASAMLVTTMDDPPMIAPDRKNTDIGWTFVDVKINEGADGVIVDLSPLNGQAPTAVRYAWDNYPCCGALDRSLAPCPMGSCPIMGSPSMLPAVPFFAFIKNGKCQCVPPQTCDQF